MTDTSFATARELLGILGERMRRLRLSRNLDQRTTAERAGVSEKALRALETGRGSSVETLLRVLKALEALQGLEMLAPHPTVDPMALLRHGKEPKRVRRSRK
jgi:transcriptional regulator with XRE-family HTH domain